MEDEDIRQRVSEYHQEDVSRNLTRVGVEEERAVYLGDYTNVVRELADHSPDDWDLARAAMLHIVHSEGLHLEHDRWLGQEIFAAFEQEARHHLYYMVLETRRDRPAPQINPEEMFPRHQMTARESTYYYSRAALAVLVSKDDPKQAIELFEDIKTLFDPRVSYCLPGVDDTNFHGNLYPDLVLKRLPVLYEKVGRFEDALNLTYSSHSYLNRVGIYPPIDRPLIDLTYCDVAIRRMEGWLDQLAVSGGISAVERCLDLIYEWLNSASEVDEEERDHFGDCPTATRQFWAWYYGNALGQLLVERPSLRASLLDEVEAGEWETCWHIAGVLFETPPESWDEYRQRALKFYNTSHIEYHQEGSRPWNAPQPPHLSAQSDLYWAMRVGFADAHSENAGERRLSLTGIADSLERIETITSSTAIHVLRTEHNTDNLVETVNDRVTPNDEYWHKSLRKHLPDLMDKLPPATVGHLIDALRYQFANYMDECKVSLCKAVESLFHRILAQRIRGGPEASTPTLAVPRGKRSPRKLSQEDWDKIPMPGWVQILRTATEGDINASLRSVLPHVFPNVDLDAVVSLHAALGEIAQLRGGSSHDSATPEKQKAKDAEKLWDLVVAGNGEGFLAKFYSALGLTEDAQGSGNINGS